MITVRLAFGVIKRVKLTIRAFIPKLQGHFQEIEALPNP